MIVFFFIVRADLDWNPLGRINSWMWTGSGLVEPPVQSWVLLLVSSPCLLNSSFVVRGHRCLPFALIFTLWERQLYDRATNPLFLWYRQYFECFRTSALRRHSTYGNWVVSSLVHFSKKATVFFTAREMVGKGKTFGLIPTFTILSSAWVWASSSSVLLYHCNHRLANQFCLVAVWVKRTMLSSVTRTVATVERMTIRIN